LKPNLRACEEFGFLLGKTTRHGWALSLTDSLTKDIINDDKAQEASLGRGEAISRDSCGIRQQIIYSKAKMQKIGKKG
jgi:hypothetical protein